MSKLELNRKYKAEKIAQGRCTVCGRMMDIQGVTCRECRVRHRERMNAIRAERLAAGNCAQCGKQPKADFQICLVCKDRRDAKRAQPTGARRPAIRREHDRVFEFGIVNVRSHLTNNGGDA